MMPDQPGTPHRKRLIQWCLPRLFPLCVGFACWLAARSENIFPPILLSLCYSIITILRALSPDPPQSNLRFFRDLVLCELFAAAGLAVAPRLDELAGLLYG